MPQPMNNAVMTNGAAMLLTKAQAGLCKIKFTRIAVGCGIYTDNEKAMSALQLATALKDERKSYSLSDISVYSEHSVKVSALITNKDPVTGEALITEGFYINEMGLFAREESDGNGNTEVLYSIAVTTGENGDFMPPYNGYSPAQIIQDYYATVNNSAEVTIDIAVGGAIAMAKDLQELKEYVQSRLSALGQVIIGAESTSLNVNDTLFIVDGMPDIPALAKFEGAFYENMVFSAYSPLSAENWGQTEEGTAIRASPVSAAVSTESEEDGEPSIIKGKLVVSEEPTSDATFFAKINE